MASNADVSRTCVSSYDKALCTTTTTTQPTAFDKKKHDNKVSNLSINEMCKVLNELQLSM